MARSTSAAAKRGSRRLKNISVVGWREWLALPALGVERIKAKIDTGARTSSLHAFGLQTFSERGTPHVSFTVYPRQRRNQPAIECVAEVLERRRIRSSSGHQELRYVIVTEVDLAGICWPIELTLADRDEMGFRMLLGREALKRRFLVDPNRSYLAGRSRADVATETIRKDRMP